MREESYDEGKRYPEVFEDTTLGILHQAFCKAASVMAELGPDGEHYWDMLHTAESLLEAMGKVEDAAFEWRTFDGRHHEDWEK